jgi:malate dehydrogenase (oxaloacetate-decarboxylating)(NADP+)
MICTGRSDYPNQVNNVLCFPYIFRGALDVSATTINEEMKLAAVEAIAALAREAPSDVAAKAYGGEFQTFGPGSLIPNPFDPRLILRIAPAVAKAACESGVATRPITDYATYQERLNRFVFRSGFIMKPVFERAKQQVKRVILAEGEDERTLRATQVVVEEGLARPILIGRPAMVESAARALRPFDPAGARFRADQSGRRSALPHLRAGAGRAAGRKGVTPDAARTLVRTNRP